MMTPLRKRLQMAEVKFEDLFIADLTSQGNIPFSLPMMDVVITDVPCSGSGTWSRTPEGLYYFQQEQLNKFISLQRAIVEQAISKLKKDSWLVYITCSVFKDENEVQISFFEKALGLECVHMQYHIGYQHRADTLFSALLRKK
jgi:16S rRNA (cytosine967-C5)-methyltransferase